MLKLPQFAVYFLNTSDLRAMSGVPIVNDSRLLNVNGGVILHADSSNEDNPECLSPPPHKPWAEQGMNTVVFAPLYRRCDLFRVFRKLKVHQILHLTVFKCRITYQACSFYVLANRLL
jgi:hypothetical protein